MPLTRNPGRVILTNSIIYFQPFNNIDSEPVTKYLYVYFDAPNNFVPIHITLFANTSLCVYLVFLHSSQCTFSSKEALLIFVFILFRTLSPPYYIAIVPLLTLLYIGV